MAQDPPDDSDPPVTDEDCLRWAREAVVAGRCGKARDHLREVSDGFRADDRFQYWRGRVYECQGEREEALRTYRRIDRPAEETRRRMERLGREICSDRCREAPADCVAAQREACKADEAAADAPGCEPQALDRACREECQTVCTADPLGGGG